MISPIIVYCRICHEEVTKPASKARKIGSTCWGRLTPAEKMEMLALAAAEDKPGYIPPERPPSITALLNNAKTRRTTKELNEADLCECGSGSLAGRCPPCNQERDDPMGFLAERVAAYIDRVRQERTTEQEQRLAARRPARRPQVRIGRKFLQAAPTPPLPQPEQLTIGAAS